MKRRTDALGKQRGWTQIVAIFSVVESCRKLGVPIRQYLVDMLPGLADRSIQALVGLTPTVYGAHMAR